MKGAVWTKRASAPPSGNEKLFTPSLWVPALAFLSWGTGGRALLNSCYYTMSCHRPERWSCLACLGLQIWGLIVAPILYASHRRPLWYSQILNVSPAISQIASWLGKHHDPTWASSLTAVILWHETALFYHLYMHFYFFIYLFFSPDEAPPSDITLKTTFRTGDTFKAGFSRLSFQEQNGSLNERYISNNRDLEKFKASCSSVSWPITK